MKIVVAPDSYKECLSSMLVADAIEAGIRKVKPDTEVLKVPLGDGGEGTIAAITRSCAGEIIWMNSLDPLGRPIKCRVGMLNSGRTLLVEMASASGLDLLAEQEKNPMRTSTYGTGLLIKQCLNTEAEEILVTVGGTATCDAGIGLGAALGAVYRDREGHELQPVGENLKRICEIDSSNLDKRILGKKFRVLCDVNNPLYGPEGASYVYSSQKGATKEEVIELDQGLRNMSLLAKDTFGIELGKIPGMGAGGGAAAGLKLFLGAKIVPGIEVVLEMLKVEDKILTADLVISGEGRTDAQSKNGKVISGLGRLCQKHGVPLLVLSGSLGEISQDLYDIGISAIFAIQEKPMTYKESIRNASELITGTTENCIRLFQSKK
ncbi:glycerate kinase [Clostridia bacterium]|nr:glycerate kinase [Clostridia bacterium]